MTPIKSHIAGPPPMVRFALLKSMIGSKVEMSLIVPVVPKIGSVHDTTIAVVPLQVVAFPENAMHGGLLLTATRSPVTFDIFMTPPPPSGMGVARATVGPTASTDKAKAPKPNLSN